MSLPCELGALDGMKRGSVTQCLSKIVLILACPADYYSTVKPNRAGFCGERTEVATRARRRDQMASIIGQPLKSYEAYVSNRLTAEAMCFREPCQREPRFLSSPSIHGLLPIRRSSV